MSDNCGKNHCGCNNESNVSQCCTENFVNKEYEIALMNEVYRVAEMTLNAVDEILDDIKDSSFKEQLSAMRTRYVLLKDRAVTFMHSFDYEIKKFDKFSKFMQKSAIAMNLMRDDSDSYIAELLLKGIDMGIISVMRCMNTQKSAISEGGKSMANGCLDLLKESREAWEKYL